MSPNTVQQLQYAEGKGGAKSGEVSSIMQRGCKSRTHANERDMLNLLYMYPVFGTTPLPSPLLRTWSAMHFRRSVAKASPHAKANLRCKSMPDPPQTCAQSWASS